MIQMSMSRDRWRVLEPLLDAALELDPAKRSSYLRDACGADSALRSEAMSLLAACEDSDGLLSRPAVVAYEPLLLSGTRELPRLLGGRYHIVREIGRGGMATVYLADDPKHGRHVAVKVLHADVARLIGRERFLREIAIAARLSHPHILPLHDSGEVREPDADEPDFLYSVSPYVTGESLRDRLQHAPRLSTKDVLRLGREIALALDYAHRQGVVHLDVKPENILLQDGHAIIADFGIARAMRGASENPRDESTPLLGTPSYMSPEQAIGMPDVDGRSDVFSLGCVLFETVTGQRPYGRVTPSEIVERAWARAGADTSAPAERLSRQAAAVIARAMMLEREDRFATAGELAAALSDCAREQLVRGRRVRGALVACALALASTAAFATIETSPAALDPDTIAVAPVDVGDASLALWRDGFVDVMSRNLDGAGPLRAVPATVAVARWRGRSDASSARAFGARTGAGLVLFSGLLAAGDSVRATATLLDAQTGRAIADIERRDTRARMDRLFDSLTVSVLRELARVRPIDVAHAAWSPTTSLGALKAYLQGEQFYSAAAWDSAQARFERAVSLDTAFALAYHRLAVVRARRDRDNVPDSLTLELMRQPSRFTAGLGPRERLLATIDSLSSEAEVARQRDVHAGKRSVERKALVNQLLSTLESGLRQFPDDSELTFLLDEARSRFDRDAPLGRAVRGTLQPRVTDRPRRGRGARSRSRRLARSSLTR
jgi:eukaryotic-like serine/threonine-protein kinase